MRVIALNLLRKKLLLNVIFKNLKKLKVMICKFKLRRLKLLIVNRSHPVLIHPSSIRAQKKNFLQSFRRCSSFKCNSLYSTEHWKSEGEGIKCLYIAVDSTIHKFLYHFISFRDKSTRYLMKLKNVLYTLHHGSTKIQIIEITCECSSHIMRFHREHRDYLRLQKEIFY